MGLISCRFEDAYRDVISSALPFAMNSEFSGVLKMEMVSIIRDCLHICI